jgi:SAM-dependent MidA family methyltransferase
MSQAILPDPPIELKRLSNALSKRLEDEIRASGPMPFARFMQRALYEPGLGYYSAGLHKFGASGDFVTAPELGPLFAACMARQVSEVADLLGGYSILEVGAGTGLLCTGLLRELSAQRPPDHYFILETSADLREVQRQHIAAEAPGWLERVTWLDQPPVAAWRGVLIANEVIDALAAERFRITPDGVEQVCVTLEAGSLAWAARPAPADLERAVRQAESSLDRPYPAGYCSEIRPHLPLWLDALTNRMQRGLALFIDYGYPRGEYYLPERANGTLMCHYRHRAHGDVFFWPGLQDITAWVDFTALAEAADACRLDVTGYTNQAMFLLGCGLDVVLAERLPDCSDTGLALNAEARQLTLPGMMGERFQVMGLSRDLANPEQPLAGFSLQDLRYRL